jgi:hypothetical protein
MGQRLRQKKKKKKKEKSRVSSNWANIDANIPTVSNTDDGRPKKGSKNNYVSQKCKPFLGVLVSTSMSASLPATGRNVDVRASYGGVFQFWPHLPI